MEKTNCNGCHYEHSCPMAEAGFGYFTMDVCPYIKNEHTNASNPAKVVFTKNDLQCLIEAIVKDCNVDKEDIVEVLEGVLTSVRGEGSETDNKKGIEECCLKVFDNEEVEHWQDVRERAAIAAMQGILCSPIVEGVDPNPSQENVAKLAIMQADALVEELKKKN